MAHTVIQQIEDYSYATRIDKWVEAGATSMVLRAPVKGLVGKTIEVDPITNKERVIVSAVQNSTVTFSPALSNSYQAGTIVRRIFETDASGLKELYIPISGAYDAVAAAAIKRTDADAEGFPMLDNVPSYAFGDYKVPVDYKSDGKLYVILVSAASGNVYGILSTFFGAADESWTQHNETSGAGADGIGQLVISRATRTITFSDLAKGDYVSVQYVRLADNALDTVGNTVYVKGFLFTYKADD